MLRLFAKPANIRAPVFVVAATLPNPAGGWEALQRILRNSLIIPETSLSSRARRYWLIQLAPTAARLIQLAPTAASDLDPQRSSISAKKKKNDETTGNTHTQRKGSQSDVPALAADGDPDLPHPSAAALRQCGTCGVRLTQSALLCNPCALKNKAPPVASQTLLARRAAPSALLATLKGHMRSLQDLCIQVVSTNIHMVEGSFGDLSIEAIDKICQLVCKERKLSSSIIPLFLHSDLTYLDLYDCADVKSPAYFLIGQCPLLTRLHLDNCGMLEGDGLCAISDGCPLLEQVELDGCFRVFDADMATFVSQLTMLQSLVLKNSFNIGKLTAAAVAAKPRGLRQLCFEQCPGFADDALELMLNMPQVGLHANYKMTCFLSVFMENLNVFFLISCHKNYSNVGFF